uniref:TP53-binding protein 1 n=1 Tax=Hippocampus comes TaxID=109280 RepID=A0A3Q2YRG6_HIPCM
MDPDGSELDSSLPQPENPCLIVEDSQPDSVALEDDPETSYRAVLARRLSNLQPSACSPVLVSGVAKRNMSKHYAFLVTAVKQTAIRRPYPPPPPSSEMDLPIQSFCISSRSEVSSSSQSSQALNVQVLLHSQCLKDSGEPEQREHQIMSSQQDMFDVNKTGAAVNSTVSEPEQQGSPSSTPAHTLRLLHLSGQETLEQPSLSQGSVDYVAPTPDNFPHTPMIVPNSPTGPESQHGNETFCADEPMDTWQPAEERAPPKEEVPMETEASSKPQPPTSTPISQSSPGFVLEQPLSLPTQPEFSHDVFVSTQSQETPQPSNNKTDTLSLEFPRKESSPAFTTPLQLSVNMDGDDDNDSVQKLSEEIMEDTQATQIEELGEQPGADTTDSVFSRHDQTTECTGARTESQSDPSSKHCTQPTPFLNSSNVIVKGCDPGLKDSSLPVDVSCSQSKIESSDVNVNSCILETPSDVTPCSLESQSVISQMSVLDVAKSDLNALQIVESPSQLESQSCGSMNSQRGKVKSNEPADIEEAVSEEEEVAMEEESTLGEGAPSGIALVLSQSELVSSGDKDGADGDERIVTVSESSGDSQAPPKSPSQLLKGTSSGSSPGKVSSSTNGHEAMLQEAEGHRNKSFSDSSGVIILCFYAEMSFHFTLPKDGELIGPVVGATPPLINQLKAMLRHSTPIETFNDKPDVAGDVSADAVMAAKDDGLEECGDELAEKGDSRLSLRMKLVTPVEEGSSERFSLQSKPAEHILARSYPWRYFLSTNSSCAEPEEDESVAKVTTVTKAETSPSVFTRVRQVHRQQEAEDEDNNSFPGGPNTPVRSSGPTHRRHVRTIQEVRTTITRIITDVYYEDGKEVDRKVTEENEDPVVDCQVLENDISPCRTISSSLTSGDLGDISSLSSKASSLQQSSGGASSTATGLSRPEFIMPPSRSAKSVRGGGASSLPPLSAPGQPQSSSEDEPYTLPPRVPVTPTDDEVPCHSNSLQSSPEEASSAGSSFVGLRVVAKWSSNGYFYSGRIVKDPGEGRFRLRFDDGYECEVAGKDILLCDPIPLETEVTALVENEFFSVGVVKGYRTEGHDLFYNVEREGQEQWYNRTSVILSLDQGNRLREHHSLGPYEPSTPLAKASDISLDNLVEGKRRRRGAPAGSNTPNHSSSSSPRNPGPSTKRRLRTLDNEPSPAKRSRRAAGARAVGVCNTSGSGTDLAAQPCDPAETHGPMPQNTSLFMGFAFMLTASSERDRLNNKLTIEEEEEEEEDYVQTGPFNKAYTESQLLAGGGFVLPDFNEEQCKAAYQSLLIVDQHCRTRKYLLCLASGVPCVSHFWVRDCCKDNKLLNYRNYLLPAGLGPNDAIVEWHPRCSPFKDLHFFLVFEKPVELWAQLVTMGGASSVRHFHSDKDGSDVPAGKYDVVVSDHSCPPLLEKNVTSLQVPLVSPEWLIQSVICGDCENWDSNTST